MSKAKAKGQPPEVLAMILADSVLRDAVSNKHYIQGTYAVVAGAEFPLRHGPFVVYVALTNGHGQTPLRMRLVDVDDEHEPLFEINTALDFRDPLMIAEIVFAHPVVTFPAPGEYRLQLFGADEPIRERRLQAILVTPPGA